MNVKEWKYQYFEWGLILWKSSVKEWCKKWKSKVKNIENLIFWLWLSKCNIIWAYVHCSAVQRNPLQFLWKLLWKLATVHFSEIDFIWTKVIDKSIIYQNWWISNRCLRGRGVGVISDRQLKNMLLVYCKSCWLIWTKVPICLKMWECMCLKDSRYIFCLSLLNHSILIQCIEYMLEKWSTSKFCLLC